MILHCDRRGEQQTHGLCRTVLCYKVWLVSKSNPILTNARLVRRTFTLRPFDDIPDEAWPELVDPVGFVVGSILVLFYGSRSASGGSSLSRDPVLVGQRIGWRFGATAVVLLVVIMPVLVGLLFPEVATGDPFAYALTLLAAGAITFVPGRVADLRDKGRVRGSGYPKTLRKAMWYLESVIAIIAVVVIVAWKFGGPGNHQVVRAVVWGLLAVCAAEFYTFGAVRNIALAEADDADST